MKRMVIFLLLCLGFAGCDKEVTFSAIGSTTDIHDLDDTCTYTAQCKEIFTFCATDSKFNVIQGGYFDGEQFYIAANYKMEDGEEQTTILVLNKEGELLRESPPLPLEHANNITYNQNINRLVVSHCQSKNGHGNRYSLVDPQTFAITDLGENEYTFFSLTYSPEKNMYASGRAAGKILDVWDGNLNHMKSMTVECPASMAQGAFCDNQGIYFLRAAQNGLVSEIRIYDWMCNLVRTIPLVHAEHIEPENINIAGNTVYVICNDWKRNCGVAYTLTFVPNRE